MRRLAIIVLFVALVLGIAGCASSGGVAKTPATGETTQGLAPGNRDEGSVLVNKTKMYLDGGVIYDPAKFPKASMNGEPSDVAFFKPPKDQGILDRNYPDFDNKTFKFLSIAISTVNPASYYMFDKDGGSLNKAAAGTGYKFAKIEDDGDNKILPNIYLGYYDFAWVPFDQLPELWSGYESRQQELWTAGNDYQVIGVACDEGQVLLAAPEIKTLKDLGGKQVGVMNPNFGSEAALNAMLVKNGLATESAGGTVKIAMAAPGFVMNDLLGMNNAAAFARSKYADELETKFGFKPLASTDDVWGGRTPRLVLIARRDIVEKHPDIVQIVVQQNYDAVKQAIKSDEWKKPATEILTAYKLKYSGPPASVRPPKQLDAQANPVYLKGVIDYMTTYGYFKIPYSYDQLVNQSFYDKVKK